MHNRFIVSFLLILSGLNVQAQDNYKFPRLPPRPYKPIRIIVFEKSKFPFTVYKLHEKANIRFTLKNTNGYSIARVTRIKGDSIYLDNAGYHLDDLTRLSLSSFTFYNKADSSQWIVSFPSDDVYSSRATYYNFNKAHLADHKARRRTGLIPVFHKNNLKLNMTKLFNMEISIAYERRFSSKWSWETEAGYNFQVVYSSAGDFAFNAYPLWKFGGFSLQSGPRFYVRPRLYFEPLFHYRYQETDSNFTRFPSYGYEVLQDQFRNDFGLSLRMGHMVGFGGLVMDIYWGLGVRALLVHEVAYAYYLSEEDDRLIWYNQNHQPVISDYTTFLPIINVGVKLGFGF